MPHKDPEKRKAYHQAYSRRYAVENKDKIREQQREWKRLNRQRRVKDPESRKRHNARARIQARVKRGTWPHASVFLCTDCNMRATEYHHPDYNQPLWIEPLCQKCHLKIHGKTLLIEDLK
jgi:hypothetical protein